MFSTRTGSGRGALLAGGVAALLASTCCAAPLLLATLGVSGAWIGNLTALAPLRPLFIAAALLALAFAWRRIYRPAAACAPNEVCAAQPVRRGDRVAFWLVALLVVAAIAFPYVASALL